MTEQKYIDIWTGKVLSIAQWLASLLADQTTPGLIPSIPVKNLNEKIVEVAEVNQQRWLEESGQWLENVDRTRLVLASGEPVQQKSQPSSASVHSGQNKISLCSASGSNSRLK